MTQFLKEAIDALAALEGLPEEEQKSIAAGVLDLVESTKAHRLHAGRGDAAKERPFWEVIDEITSDVPDEIWETLPSDGAAEIDHYLYGTPKKHS